MNSLNWLGSQISFTCLAQRKSYLSLPLPLALLLIFCWLWSLKPCEIFSFSQAECPQLAKASASCALCFHAEKLMWRSRAELKPTNVVGQLRTPNPNIIWTIPSTSPPTVAKTFSAKLLLDIPCFYLIWGGSGKESVWQRGTSAEVEDNKPQGQTASPISVSAQGDSIPHSLERKGRTILHHRASTQPTAE